MESCFQILKLYQRKVEFYGENAPELTQSYYMGVFDWLFQTYRFLSKIATQEKFSVQIVCEILQFFSLF